MAVGCVAYQLLKDNLVSLHSVHICHCSSTILAFVLCFCFHPIISLPLKRDRIKQKKGQWVFHLCPFELLGIKSYFPSLSFF